jgi:hypothetical protein
MCLLFLWADAADEIGVCDFSCVRDLFFLDEKAGVGAVDALAVGSIGSDALE